MPKSKKPEKDLFSRAKESEKDESLYREYENTHQEYLGTTPNPEQRHPALQSFKAMERLFQPVTVEDEQASKAFFDAYVQDLLPFFPAPVPMLSMTLANAWARNVIRLYGEAVFGLNTYRNNMLGINFLKQSLTQSVSEKRSTKKDIIDQLGKSEIIRLIDKLEAQIASINSLYQKLEKRFLKMREIPNIFSLPIHQSMLEISFEILSYKEQSSQFQQWLKALLEEDTR